MPRDSSVVLQEMIDVIEHLKTALKNHDYDSFQKDWALRHAA